MKKAFEDYKEMIIKKPQVKWIKIHWKGWILTSVIAGLIPVFVYNMDDIVDSIKIKFLKEEEENE